MPVNRVKEVAKAWNLVKHLASDLAFLLDFLNQNP